MYNPFGVELIHTPIFAGLGWYIHLSLRDSGGFMFNRYSCYVSIGKLDLTVHKLPHRAKNNYRLRPN